MSGSCGRGRCNVVVLVDVEQGKDCRTWKRVKEEKTKFFCMNSQESATLTVNVLFQSKKCVTVSMCWEQYRKKVLNGCPHIQQGSCQIFLSTT